MLRILSVGVAIRCTDEQFLIDHVSTVEKAIAHPRSHTADVVVLGIGSSLHDLQTLRRAVPQAQLLALEPASRWTDSPVDQVVAPAKLSQELQALQGEIQAERVAQQLLTTYRERPIEPDELAEAQVELADAPEATLTPAERKRALARIRARLPRRPEPRVHRITPGSHSRHSNGRRFLLLLSIGIALAVPAAIWWVKSLVSTTPTEPDRSPIAELEVPEDVRRAVPMVVELLALAAAKTPEQTPVPIEAERAFERVESTPEIQELGSPVLDWLRRQFGRVNDESSASGFLNRTIGWLTDDAPSSVQRPARSRAERRLLTAMIANLAERFPILSSADAEALLAANLASEDESSIAEAIWAAAFVAEAVDGVRLSIRPLLLEAPPLVRRAAANVLSLSRITSPDLAPTYRHAIESFPEDSELIGIAMALFARWNDHSADDLFARDLDSVDISRRLSAARHFAGQGDSRALQALEEIALTTTGPSGFRALAATALVRLDGATDALCLDLLEASRPTTLPPVERVQFANQLRRLTRRESARQIARVALAQCLFESDEQAGRSLLQLYLSLATESDDTPDEMGELLSAAPYLDRLFEIADQEPLGARAAELAGALIDHYQLR